MNIKKSSELEFISLSKFIFALFLNEKTRLFQLRSKFQPVSVPNVPFGNDNSKKATTQINSIQNKLALYPVNGVKTFIYWFFPGWFLLGIVRVFFYTELWHFMTTKTRFVITQHRVAIRSKLSSQPLHIITFLSFLPFVLGFAQFLQHKYKHQINQVFLNKNIPAFTIPTETLKWETLEYVLKDYQNLFSFHNQIHWYENYLLIKPLKHASGFSNKQYRIRLEKQDPNSVRMMKQSNRPLPNVSIGNTNDSVSLNSVQSVIKKSASWIVLNSQTGNPCNGNLQENPFFLDQFYIELDEFPSKMEGLIEHKLFVNSINTHPLLHFPNLIPQHKKNNRFNSFSFNKKDSSQILSTLRQAPNKNVSLFGLAPKPSVFTNHIIVNQTPLTNSSTNVPFFKEEPVTAIKESSLKTLIKMTKDQKGFFDKMHRFFDEWSLFQEEFRQFFVLTDILPTLEKTKASGQQLALEFTKPINLNFLNKLLFELDQLIIPEGSIQTRLMSGYKYPDMSTREIKWLMFQQRGLQNKRLKNIKIQLPPSFGTTQLYSIDYPHIPSFFITTKPTTLTDFSVNRILYDGPGVVVNPNKGLDWNISSKNQIETVNNYYAWLKRYLSTENSLVRFKKNYFGVYDSPEFSFPNGTFGNEKLISFPLPNETFGTGNTDETLLSNTNSQKYWVENLPIYRKGTITNTEPNIFSFDRFIQIPALSEKEWKDETEQHTKISIKNSGILETEYNDIMLPILETKVPKSNKPNLLFSNNSNLDYEFLLPGGNSKNRFLEFTPPTISFLEKETFGTKLSSGVYRRNPSIFSQSSKQPRFLQPAIFFQDVWEPLTTKSWLIVSQIGFAFLVFKILKGLADNYGRELLVYLLDLVAVLGFLDDDLKQEIEILTGQKEKGFRIINKTSKNFSDIAGIKKLLPDIVEIVWFLRNAGREFTLSKNLPRGILLTGPPGTGKTLLVQALAGEAEVPVLALSGSSLIEPGESGAVKLEILFQEARRLAPCIVFIDEIDTLAQKREQVLQNPMGADELIESMSATKNLNSRSSVQFSLRPEETEKQFESVIDQKNGNEQIFAQQDLQREKLRMLMQFLVELDGIQGRDGVIVIGATNRPEMLDAAILRPGRFDRLLELGLPGPEKRKEILQLYSQTLGIETAVSWSYLAQRTAGFSAADLASIMNQSSLKAILSDSQHTVTSIEHGIDRITTFDQNKPTHVAFKELYLLRLAYYQAGKILISLLLEDHPPLLIAHLWPRRSNSRALQISANLQKYFFQFARRSELEQRIIGCYAGKAAEILFLQNSSISAGSTDLSDLGSEDILFAQNLINCMIDKWFLYSKNHAIKHFTQITENKNTQEYMLTPEKIPFFQALTNDVESSPAGESFEFSPYTDNVQHSTNPLNIPIDQQPQTFFPVAWWQFQIADELELSTRAFADWYRLYLPDPQETERNLEWIPPDEFYHSNTLIEELSSSITWNDLAGISSDYQKHSLVLQSFNKALSLLDQNREILDLLASELMQKEVLRQPEIEKIIRQFTTKFVSNKPEKLTVVSTRVIQDSWGNNSRRTQKHWVDFDDFIA
jgi:ATP-dependent Zn protease